MLKKINTEELIERNLSEELQREGVTLILLSQISAMEQVMDQGRGFVRSSLAFNHCSYLLDQLQHYIRHAFLCNTEHTQAPAYSECSTLQELVK